MKSDVGKPGLQEKSKRTSSPIGKKRNRRLKGGIHDSTQKRGIEMTRRTGGGESCRIRGKKKGMDLERSMVLAQSQVESGYGCIRKKVQGKRKERETCSGSKLRRSGDGPAGGHSPKSCANAPGDDLRVGGGKQNSNFEKHPSDQGGAKVIDLSDGEQRGKKSQMKRGSKCSAAPRLRTCYTLLLLREGQESAPGE